MLELFGIMTDTQAIDVVTIDFKGTRVRCFVSGSTDYVSCQVLAHLIRCGA